MYIVLISSLFLLLFINIKFTKEWLSPGVLYCLVLLVASIYGLFWFPEWKLGSYGVNTYLVIVIGAVAFSVPCCLVHYLLPLNKREPEICVGSGTIKIRPIKFIIILYVELLATGLAIRFYGNSLSNLSKAIIDYRVASVQRGTSMPRYLSVLLNMCMLNGYISGYAIANNFILQKKVSFDWLTLFVLSVFNSLLGGSRGGAISILVVTFCTFYFFYHCLDKKDHNIRRRILVRTLLVAFVGAGFIFFINSATFLGRTIEYSPAYYIAIHLSAPLKILDINISLISKGVHITGTEFRSVNGISLGNVGTVYTYEYIRGGIWYVIGASILVGLIGTILYEIVSRRKIISSCIDYFLVLYMYLLYSISMVIFGSTMLDSVFSMFFVKILIGLLVLDAFYSFEVVDGRIIVLKRFIK